MRKVWLAVLGLTVIGYGCGPQLAQSPYGQKETQWEGYVKQSYPSWTPAKTIAVVEQQAADEQKAKEEQQIKAEAATSNTVAPISNEEKSASPAPNLLPLQPMPELPEHQLMTAKPESKEYTVKKGDTLTGIAKSFYGHSSKWRLIRDANPGKIQDPNKLKVGTKISIPTL